MHPGERQNTVFASRVKRRNHRDICSGLDFRCVGEDINLPFIQCGEEVDLERWLLELHLCMHEVAGSPDNKPLLR